jgi:translation initiation factor IF-1
VTVYKKLYWCYTWVEHKRYFLIADSARKAKQQFAAENGLYQKDVSVNRVSRLPGKHQKTIQIHPDDNLLIDCGVEFINKLHRGHKVSQVIKRMLKPGGRIFNFQNRIFQEES